VNSVGSGLGLVVGCCECGDEPSDSGATELISYLLLTNEREAFDIISLSVRLRVSPDSF
jgi:hypothetical protein